MRKIDDQMEKEANKNSLCFIDIRNFVAGGSLPDFVMNFGETKKRQKGFFPYDFVNYKNWRTELYKTTLFKKSTFYSNLTKKGLTDYTVSLFVFGKIALFYFFYYPDNAIIILKFAR